MIFVMLNGCGRVVPDNVLSIECGKVWVVGITMGGKSQMLAWSMVVFGPLLHLHDEEKPKSNFSNLYR